MTRVEFLNNLYRRLGALTREQAEEHLTYYAEMLADRMDEGMTEEEAVASMEDVDVIASRILLEELGDTVRTEEPGPSRRSRRLLWAAVAAVAAVLCLCVVIVFSVSSLFGVRAPDPQTTVSGTSAGESMAVEMVTDNSVTQDVGRKDGYHVKQSLMVSTNAIREIEIEWVSGEVIVQPWDGEEISLTEEIAESAADYEQMYTEVDGDTLKVYFGESGMSLFQGNKRLFLLVPAALAGGELKELKIEAASALVVVQDVSAERLTLDTTSGDCVISGGYDQVEMDTVSGNMRLEGPVKVAEFDSTSGELQMVASETLQRLAADTISGSMTVELPEGMEVDLDFSTVSGYLEGGGVPVSGSGCKLQVDTVSGNLYLSAR